MSANHSDPSEPRRLTDQEIIQVHDHAGQETVDDGGNYKLLPLVMLAALSSLIFFGGTYIGLYAGHFAPTVYDERGTASAVVVTKVDPAVIGKKKYELLCTTCHGPAGMGTPGLFPPLAKSEWVVGTDEKLIRILLNGLAGPVTVDGKEFGAAAGAVAMPAIGPGGAGWNDSDIAAVATYVRQAFGNTAPEISTEKVTEIRTKVGTRGAWSSAELQALK